jgi:PAS domain-containing protein
MMSKGKKRDGIFLSKIDPLQELMHGMPVAIGVAELEPGVEGGTISPRGKVLFYNQRWQEMFGFGIRDVTTAAEATERLYPDPVYRAECYRRRQQAVAEAEMEGRPSRPIKLSVRVADGSTRTLLTGTTVIGNRMVVSMEELPEDPLKSLTLTRAASRKISVGRSGSAEILIDPDAVAAVLAEGKYSKILAGASLIPDRRTLGEWESLLPQKEFSRLDRSSLVRTSWIHAIRAHGRGARLSFAHAAVEIDIGRTARERLMNLLPFLSSKS